MEKSIESIPPKSTVFAVVLAAGSGSRFTSASHKLAVEIDGVPMVRRTIMNCLAANFAATIAVTGAESEHITDLIRDLPVPVVFNPDWIEGQFSSLKRGLSYLIENETMSNSPVCFVLADQPFVKVETYNRLIRSAERQPGKIVVPRFAGVRGNPTIFPARLFEEMLNAPIDDTGGRRWLTPENIFWVDVDDPGVRKDIDRICDLK